MMRYWLFSIIGLGIIFSITLTSCAKFLSEEPDDMLSADSIFTSLKNTNGYLAQVYANVPDPYGNRGGWSGDDASFNQLSDESNYFAEHDFPISAFKYNTLSASFGAFEYIWPEFYKPVRTATDFINKIDGANPREVSDNLKTHYKGEARAMRAIFYYWLVRLYGPVIILDDQVRIDASNEELAKMRTPLEDCVDYIVTQLDSAYNEIKSVSTSNLPLNNEYGRVTKGVCKAYKEKILLWAASPLFNGNSMYKDIVNPDGTHLFPLTYDQNKWKVAADAAKAFIDEFVPGTYDIFTVSDPDPYMAAYYTARDVISTDWNKEWIFGKSMASASTYNYNGRPMLVGYNSEEVKKGGGYAAVEQSMVDAYYMENGRKIGDALSDYRGSGFSDFQSPYDIKARRTYNQWTNREPRFYVGVTYNNSYWMEQEGSSGKEVVVNFEYHGNSGKIQSDHDYSSTGYLLRKNITVGNNARGWCNLRLSEIYLDYAEALNEYDPGNPDIIKYLNIIRVKSGIPAYGEGADPIPVPGTQSAMREAIHHERRVEFAFENVRYFDQRRWMTAAVDLSKPVMGMNIDADGDDFYKLTLIQNISFTPRNYLWAIPSSEIRKDGNLTQNLGW